MLGGIFSIVSGVFGSRGLLVVLTIVISLLGVQSFRLYRVKLDLANTRTTLVQTKSDFAKAVVGIKAQNEEVNNLLKRAIKSKTRVMQALVKMKVDNANTLREQRYIENQKIEGGCKGAIRWGAVTARRLNTQW